MTTHATTALPNSSTREITILGSTGSIGTQAIDIITANPGSFTVKALGAAGSRLELLAEQTRLLHPDVVAIANVGLEKEFTERLSAAGLLSADHPDIITGPTAMEQVAAISVHTVLNGITGSVGLRPTLAALNAGSYLALANKESLIAGGPLVRAIAKPGQIIPVDSEHSALAQCLRSGDVTEINKLIITASGGPFKGRSRAELANVIVADALAHPTWDMGPVVTINSATLVNKALEVIEAHELFGIDYDNIEVTVHRQSVIHSMVEFMDGSTIAQASPPDMRLPISHALAWPFRVAGAASPVDWTKSHTWTFEPLDETAFPAVALAKAVGRAGGVYPAIYNAANEEAVAAFRDGRLSFVGIVDTLASVVESAPEFEKPSSVEAVDEAENWARRTARGLISLQRNFT